MKIFRIELNERDYDMYDGFVVRAESKEDAVNFVRNGEHKEHGMGYFEKYAKWDKGYTVKEISADGEKEIIMDSFCAG